jgi:hypothetical protein
LVEQSELLVKQHLYDPLPDPDLPNTDSQALQWLFDFTGLKVPVTAVFYQQMLALQGPQQRLVPELDAASAVVTFTELLQTAPDLPFSSEMDTSVYVCNFIGRVWRTLAKYSPTSLQYGLLLNKASQLSSVSSHAIAHKLRPDTMLIAENCTLMLGEDKHIDLAAAYADLGRKRVDLSGMHYGPLKFMLGYAAAGTAVQWCFLPCRADEVRSLLFKCFFMKSLAILASADFVPSNLFCPSGLIASALQPVKVMGHRLDFRIAKDRLSFLLSLVQAYRLLAVMSAAVPQLPGRWPLYSEIARENSMCVSAAPTLSPDLIVRHLSDKLLMCLLCTIWYTTSCRSVCSELRATCCFIDISMMQKACTECKCLFFLLNIRTVSSIRCLALRCCVWLTMFVLLM